MAFSVAFLVDFLSWRFNRGIQTHDFCFTNFHAKRSFLTRTYSHETCWYLFKEIINFFFFNCSIFIPFCVLKCVRWQSIFQTFFFWKSKNNNNFDCFNLRTFANSKTMATPTKTFKIIIIGDGNVGKTCFLLTKIYKIFPREHIPTVFDNYVTKVSANGEIYELELWDTAG